MNAQRTTNDDGDKGGRVLPPALAERHRGLIAVIDDLVARPYAATLDEGLRAQAIDTLHKLCDGIELDLRFFLGDADDRPPRIWGPIAPLGVPVDGLGRHILTSVLERGLAGNGEESPGGAPCWRNDADAAAQWTRVVIADRRRRDGWDAPIVPLSDLSLELQAALVDCVAGAMLAEHGNDDTIGRYTDAAKAVVALHREEIAIGIAAARFTDAALGICALDALILDCVARNAWPAIAALIADRADCDRADAVIALATASFGEIETWLAALDLPSNAVAAMIDALVASGHARSDVGLSKTASLVNHERPNGISAAAHYYRRDAS